jgi:general secretion pathway protein G
MRTGSTSLDGETGRRGDGEKRLTSSGFVSPRRSVPLSPRLKNGFTMIELMIVMAIVVILISVAVPMYQKAMVRSKESVLKNNLFTLRTVIDEYTYDKQKAPQSLQDLVTEGYLREVPMDPITRSNQSWRVIQEDAMASVNQSEPGIFDVKSGSDKTSLEGTPYAEW